MKELSTQVKLKNGNMKTIYVAVEDELAEFLETKTEEEKHNFLVYEYKSKLTERKETRRHLPIGTIGTAIRDHRQDIDFVLECEEYYRKELEIEKLQKQVFAKFLTERQAEAFYQLIILYYKKTKIAKNMGITESAVRKLIEKATCTMKPFAYKAFRYFEGKQFVIEDDDDLAEELTYSNTNYLRYFLNMK